MGKRPTTFDTILLQHSGTLVNENKHYIIGTFTHEEDVMPQFLLVYKTVYHFDKVRPLMMKPVEEGLLVEAKTVNQKDEWKLKDLVIIILT